MSRQSTAAIRDEARLVQQTAINDRVRRWRNGELSVPQVRRITRKIGDIELKPNVTNLGKRTVMTEVLSSADRFISDDELYHRDGVKKLEPVHITVAQKVDDANQTYRRLWGILQPEYNLLEPFTIYDCEPFVRQATTRKLSLMFRNGFEITGDRDDDINYIQARFDAMEFVMERTTEDFFKQLLFNLLLCSNCFLQKIRSEKATIVKKKDGASKEPVAGYRLIPAHMIFPYLENGIPVKWRRFFDTGAPFEDIELDDIVHLKWDVKPGHRYGTPRTVGVRDDLFALRRLEENVELLFINFLFPLFHVAVGSPENPAGFDAESGATEVDMILAQIQSMPKEGIFVSDERTKVEAVGAEGKALDYSKMLEHYKTRAYVGLGVSAVDMGDAKSSGSRSTADNISQNLKDNVKSDLETFGGMMRVSIFKEFFREATYSTSVPKACARTYIHFHEIDLDSKIKKENHSIQKFLNNLIDEDEARKEIGYRRFQDIQRKKLNFALHTVRLVKETAEAKTKSAIDIAEHAAEKQKELLPAQTEAAESQAKTQAKLSATQTSHHERKAKASIELIKAKTEHAKTTGAGAPQRATAKKSSPGAKSVQNKETPTNQHGSNLGPTKAKSGLEHLAAEFTDGIVQLIEDLKDSNGTVDHEAYQMKVGPLLEGILSRCESQTGAGDGNHYTRQVRTGLDHLRSVVATTYDPEILAVLVSSALDGAEGSDASITSDEFHASDWRDTQDPADSEHAVDTNAVS